MIPAKITTDRDHAQFGFFWRSSHSLCSVSQADGPIFSLSMSVLSPQFSTLSDATVMPIPWRNESIQIHLTCSAESTFSSQTICHVLRSAADWLTNGMYLSGKQWKKTNLAGFDIEFNSNIGDYEYEWAVSVCVCAIHIDVWRNSDIWISYRIGWNRVRKERKRENGEQRFHKVINERCGRKEWDIMHIDAELDKTVKRAVLVVIITFLRSGSQFFSLVYFREWCACD